MKIYYLLIIFLTNSSIIAQKEFIRLISLPDEARNLLTKNFGNWDFYNSPVPYFDSTGKHTAWEYKDIISGDFDDNGEIDFSLIIKPDSSEQGYFIVLLKHSGSFELIEILKQPHSQDIVLYLISKGTLQYDYESGKEFIMPIDGIFLGFYEKGGSTFYFNGDHFIEFTSSD